MFYFVLLRCRNQRTARVSASSLRAPHGPVHLSIRRSFQRQQRPARAAIIIFMGGKWCTSACACGCANNSEVLALGGGAVTGVRVYCGVARAATATPCRTPWNWSFYVGGGHREPSDSDVAQAAETAAELATPRIQ